VRGGGGHGGGRRAKREAPKAHAIDRAADEFLPPLVPRERKDRALIRGNAGQRCELIVENAQRHVGSGANVELFGRDEEQAAQKVALPDRVERARYFTCRWGAQAGGKSTPMV
jgi:hypothetical protein